MGSRKDFDQSEEARTPETGTPTAVGAVTIMRVVDMALRFPDASKTELGTMIGSNRHMVARALSTPMARARMESAYDVRAIVKEKLKQQALNSFELLTQVQLRCLEQLADEDKVVDAALLAAATRTSLETLKGVGVLKDHSIEETVQMDTDGVAALLDKADALRAEIEGKMKGKMEDVEEAEVVDTEGFTEEASEHEEKM